MGHGEQAGTGASRGNSFQLRNSLQVAQHIFFPSSVPQNPFTFASAHEEAAPCESWLTFESDSSAHDPWPEGGGGGGLVPPPVHVTQHIDLALILLQSPCALTCAHEVTSPPLIFTRSASDISVHVCAPPLLHVAQHMLFASGLLHMPIDFTCAQPLIEPPVSWLTFESDSSAHDPWPEGAAVPELDDVEPAHARARDPLKNGGYTMLSTPAAAAAANANADTPRSRLALA